MSPERGRFGAAKRSVVALLLCFAFAQPAAAATYYVRTGGNDANSGLSPSAAWATIQHSVDVAVAGDVVHVGGGTYTEDVDSQRSGTAAQPIRFLADTTGAFTGDAGTVTITSPGDDILVIDNDDYLHFVGFRLVDGKKGIKIKKALGIRIEACDIGDNGAEELDNAGIEVDDAEAFIGNCDIHDNGKAGLIVKKDANVTLVDTILRSNGKQGIEIKDNGSQLIASGCEIHANAEEGVDLDKGSAAFTECAIHDNGEHGLLVDNPNASLSVRRSDVYANGEAAFFVKKGGVEIVNSLIYGNLSHGIELDKNEADVTAWHVTIANNGGDGIFQDEGTTTLTNSIVAFNAGAGLRRDKGTLSHSFNLLFGNAGGDYVGTAASAGELSADPTFVGAGDYHLLFGSPAIDVGTDASAVTGVDRDSEPRPRDAGWDMGAYEYPQLMDHFEILHDGTGIHCLDEPVTVRALDLGGNPVVDYAGTITLDTQTGRGTWSSDPGNSGVLVDATPNDGLAEYTFDPGDAGEASFLLSYREGTPTFDIDVFETATPTITDDDSEGPISFFPSGFTVTANALPNPPPNPIADPIPAQTAGLAFAVHITAFGQTPTDPVCGVIESYTGARGLEFWFDWSDPASGTRLVTIDGTAIASAEAGAAAQVVAFSNGQALVTAKYKDVGRIRIHVKDDTVPEPAGGIRGATNLFVVGPADFVITAVERPDTTPNPGVDVPTGAVFVAAGTPFRAIVEALDAEGDLVPNYGNESTPEGVRLTAASLVAPVGGRNGTNDDGAIGNATAFAATATPGEFLGTTFYWDEVGAVTLRASIADADYLGAGDVLGTPSGTVGRFVPDHFDVSPSTPRFQTACAAGAFSYVGEPFDYVPGSEPSLTVTARNAQGTTTANYAGSWFRLSAGSLTGLAYAAATGSLSAAAPSPPTVTDLGAGLGAVTFDNGPPLSFVRGVPLAPFDAELSLSVNVIDLDGVAYGANPARFGDASPGNGIDWSAGKSMRWGRIVVGNAHGSELATLPVPLRAESFDGAVFVLNNADSCTSLPVGNLLMTPVPATLVTTPTLANDPLVTGDAGLTLSPPGAGNTGIVDLEYDLSPGGANRPWLQFDWDGDGLHDDDPTGRATFGVFAGDDAVIYLRELY